MSLYATPPGANLTEDERRIRHAQLMYLMGIGDGGLPSGPVIDPRISFWAPLTNSLIPTKAGNPVFTFQRPTSTAYVADHQGILRLAQFNEARFQGARRVQNLITAAAKSSDMAAAGWTKGTVTVLARTVTATAGAGNHWAYHAIASVVAGSYGYQCRAKAGTASWIALGDGSGAVGTVGAFFNLANGTVGGIYGGTAAISATVDAEGYYLCTFNRTLVGIPQNIAVEIHTADNQVLTWAAAGTETVLVKDLMVEFVSGQSNQAPGEYVSVGVLAAPYHGNAIDGVKYFPTTNGNSVAGNIVTEAQGTLIPTATLLGYLAENASTNQCIRSQEFDNAAWVKTNITPPTPNTQTAPDGTLTAEALVATGVNGTCLQSVTVTATTWCFSTYLKRLVGTGQVAITTDGVTFVDITSLLSASAWVRVDTNKALSAGAVTPGVRLAVSGDSVAIWGAQLE